MEAELVADSLSGWSVVVLVVVLEKRWKLSIPSSAQEVAREPKSGRDFKIVFKEGERGREREGERGEMDEGGKRARSLFWILVPAREII